MRAYSIAKDASTLSQIAAPVDFSTAKTVIRRHRARKWSRVATPAISHATCMNRDPEKDFTPAQQALLSCLRTGRHTPELVAWYRSVQNNEEPRPG